MAADRTDEAAATLTERAPAKVNLSLHVLGRRADGYHALDSLVGFAAVCDLLQFSPGREFSLHVAGPTALAAGGGDDNLVLRAARALAERVADCPRGRFRLLKRLPVAAGLGGGSSDAAAALRLLARAGGLSLDDPRLMDAARATGSDVPGCLAGRARRMSGAGEILGEVIAIARLPAVLVNPRIAAPTPAVFAAVGLAPGTETGAAAVHADPLPRRDLVRRLADDRNDLEAAALTVAPRIAEPLHLLGREDGCRLARMSGSGASVFGLFASCRAAAAAAKRIRAERPEWWVVPTMIG